MTQTFKMWLWCSSQIIIMVCIKFSFSFNKTTARAATTSLKQKPGGYINCWQWPMSGGRIDSG
jgi:hypothetical protein